MGRFIHEGNTMFFTRRKREESQSEMVDLTNNLLVKVWHAKNRDGSLRLHFALRRKSESGEPYLSLTPATALELPEAIATLASAFSKVEGLPEDVRVDCGELAVLMQSVAARQGANGPAVEENKKLGRGILNLAV